MGLKQSRSTLNLSFLIALMSFAVGCAYEQVPPKSNPFGPNRVIPRDAIVGMYYDTGAPIKCSGNGSFPDLVLRVPRGKSYFLGCLDRNNFSIDPETGEYVSSPNVAALDSRLIRPMHASASMTRNFSSGQLTEVVNTSHPIIIRANSQCTMTTLPLGVDDRTYLPPLRSQAPVAVCSTNSGATAYSDVGTSQKRLVLRDADFGVLARRLSTEKPPNSSGQ